MADILTQESRWQKYGQSSKSGNTWNIAVAGRMSTAGNSYINASPLAGDIIQATVKYNLDNLDGYNSIYFVVAFGEDYIPVQHLLAEYGTYEPVSGEFTIYHEVTEEQANYTLSIGCAEYIGSPTWGINAYDVLGSIELEVNGALPPPSGTIQQSQPAMVYEFEKGWGFAGRYIPHYAEMNWWFGDSPVANTAVQKLRIHGLAKGQSLLTVAVSNMCEPVISYDRDFTEPQWVDLPREPVRPTREFMPVTNYTDLASRGVSTQFRFEGRNEDVYATEPPHVIQVTVVQGTADGATIN